MNGPLVLGLPSKGRLMEKALERLAAVGLTVERGDRGYRGGIAEQPGVEVAFLSASEIASDLKLGRVHLGVTGEDLVREGMADADTRLGFLKPLGFGQADVVVAVPACWLDVAVVADLGRVAQSFHREHGRRLRIATKYTRLTRRFFADHGISGYRIVESLGATEGAPAAGTAELIVDITTTGSTLKANHLKLLGDGLILASEAWLLESRRAAWDPSTRALRDHLVAAVCEAHG